MPDLRLGHLQKFYSLLAKLSKRSGGYRTLADATKYSWPARGVYFFMEEGENRTDTGEGLRIVRVGTHAVSTGSETRLWQRLSQHRGQVKLGGGNHRGSVFRAIVGHSLIAKSGLHCASWDKGSNAPRDIRHGEQPIEQEVSRHIRAMPFLWLSVDDAAGKDSLRKTIETNSIALLSNYQKPSQLDAASKGWLGHSCYKEKVSRSGLWNSNHVDEDYKPEFLDVFETLIDRNHS